MFKIGDRIEVVNPEKYEEYSIGDKGTVVNTTQTSNKWIDVVVDNFPYEMGCKHHTMFWHEVKSLEEDNTPFKVGDKVIPSFKVGNRVKFTESSLASGMIDATEGDVFTVKESYERAVTLKELQGCYHVTHFEHVQEKVMDNAEEKEIDWQVGQEVFCLLRGKGVVVRTGDNDGAPYVVGVDFGYTFDNYTIDGKIYDDHRGRVLFFSEPKIEAEKFPPKKPFVPKLKKGDVILVKVKDELYGEGTVRTVHSETDDRIYISDNEHYFLKKDILSIHVLSEEIKFN